MKGRSAIFVSHETAIEIFHTYDYTAAGGMIGDLLLDYGFIELLRYAAGI
jgi:hypothetical protein